MKTYQFNFASCNQLVWSFPNISRPIFLIAIPSSFSSATSPDTNKPSKERTLSSSVNELLLSLIKSSKHPLRMYSIDARLLIRSTNGMAANFSKSSAISLCLASTVSDAGANPIFHCAVLPFPCFYFRINIYRCLIWSRITRCTFQIHQVDIFHFQMSFQAVHLQSSRLQYALDYLLHLLFRENLYFRTKLPDGL